MEIHGIKKEDMTQCFETLRPVMGDKAQLLKLFPGIDLMPAQRDCKVANMDGSGFQVVAWYFACNPAYYSYSSKDFQCQLRDKPGRMTLSHHRP